MAEKLIRKLLRGRFKALKGLKEVGVAFQNDRITLLGSLSKELKYKIILNNNHFLLVYAVYEQCSRGILPNLTNTLAKCCSHRKDREILLPPTIPFWT
jgi:hypothetical protein